MTDTKAPTPWYAGLTPYIGQALVAIVAAVIGAIGTLWAQGGLRATPTPAPAIDVVRTVPANGSLVQRLAALEDKYGQYDNCTNAVGALRADLAIHADRRSAKKAAILPVK